MNSEVCRYHCTALPARWDAAVSWICQQNGVSENGARHPLFASEAAQHQNGKWRSANQAFAPRGRIGRTMLLR